MAASTRYTGKPPDSFSEVPISGSRAPSPYQGPTHRASEHDITAAEAVDTEAVHIRGDAALLERFADVFDIS